MEVAQASSLFLRISRPLDTPNRHRDLAAMPAALDLLEARRTETYTVLLDDEHGRLAFDSRVSWLEAQMKDIYRFAIQKSKEELSVHELFDLWDKMVSICDFFIDYVRIMANGSRSAVSYDDLLDLRLACDEKREFHRC